MPVAHGPVLAEPGWPAVLLEWPLEPLVWATVVAGVWWYLLASRAVPAWPGVRRAHFLAGMAALTLALASPLASYAGALFWVHMTQHLLLTMVVAPLLLLGAPLSLYMRASAPVKRVRMSKLAHSRGVRLISNPVVAWCAFTLTMWMTHFSAVYQYALENSLIHGLEHLLYLVAGLLFWWPVVGLDPGARRMRPPARLLYLLLALPQQSFLGLAIYSSDTVLYEHYLTSARAWGPNPLGDQGAAGIIMWIGGDLLFLIALVFIVLTWMRHDERQARRIDRRLGLSDG